MNIIFNTGNLGSIDIRIGMPHENERDTKHRDDLKSMGFEQKHICVTGKGADGANIVTSTDDSIPAIRQHLHQIVGAAKVTYTARNGIAVTFESYGSHMRQAEFDPAGCDLACCILDGSIIEMAAESGPAALVLLNLCFDDVGNWRGFVPPTDDTPHPTLFGFWDFALLVGRGYDNLTYPSRMQDTEIADHVFITDPAIPPDYYDLQCLNESDVAKFIAAYAALQSRIIERHEEHLALVSHDLTQEFLRDQWPECSR